jgi:hypothetical protein
MIWAATKAHTLWPDARIHGTTLGNLALLDDSDFVVGHIDLISECVLDAVTGERHYRPQDDD